MLDLSKRRHMQRLRVSKSKVDDDRRAKGLLLDPDFGSPDSSSGDGGGSLSLLAPSSPPHKSGKGAPPDENRWDILSDESPYVTLLLRCTIR